MDSAVEEIVVGKGCALITGLGLFNRAIFPEALAADIRSVVRVILMRVGTTFLVKEPPDEKGSGEPYDNVFDRGEQRRKKS